MKLALCTGWLCALLSFAAVAQNAAPPFDLDLVRDENSTPPIGPRARGPSVLRAQILLERAHFSPGELDASYGSNLKSAIAGYQRHNRLKITGVIDAKTWALLNRDEEPMLESYRITEEDVSANSQAIPEDMMDKARLPALGYGSVEEALGERFHVKPALLARMNPGKDLRKAGEEIVVPAVKTAPIEGAETLVVDKYRSTVSLLDGSGRTLAQFPATIGSRHDPLPIGDWKIKGVARDPVFKYNPDLFWDADAEDSKAILQPGPNNPVGVVWIDLSKPHYGIHGTPEPSTIRKTSSHGCIRLTNWSARIVADAVRPGMPALLRRSYP